MGVVSGNALRGKLLGEKFSWVYTSSPLRSFLSVSSSSGVMIGVLRIFGFIGSSRGSFGGRQWQGVPVARGVDVESLMDFSE